MEYSESRSQIMRTILKLILITVIFISCQDTVISPTLPPPKTTTTSTVENDPPPIRVDSPFVWGRTMLLFAGTRAEEDQIKFLYNRTMAQGIYTLQPCAEVQSWPNDRPWLPRGSSARPFDETAPAYEEIKNFLDVAATIPRAQVLVVAICNLKEDGTSPANREKWVRTIARLVTNYKNVALKIANEWKHPDSSMTEDEVANLLSAARAEGFMGELTTDDNAHKANVTYNPRLRSLVTIADFHPWRNPDPNGRDMDRFVESNGLPIVFTETTAYNSKLYDSQCDGLRTCDKNNIITYRNRAESRGIHFGYHCIGCLGWPVTEISWIPGE